jgi:hypothetical protein
MRPTIEDRLARLEQAVVCLDALRSRQPSPLDAMTLDVITRAIIDERSAESRPAGAPEPFPGLYEDDNETPADEWQADKNQAYASCPGDEN